MFNEADDIEIGSPERPGIGLFDRERYEDYSKNHRIISLREKITFQAQYLDHLKEAKTETDQRLKDIKVEFSKHRTLFEELKKWRETWTEKLAAEEIEESLRPPVCNLIADYAHAETRVRRMRQRKIRLEIVTYDLMKRITESATSQLKNPGVKQSDIDARSNCSVESDKTITGSDSVAVPTSFGDSGVPGWNDSTDIISVIERSVDVPSKSSKKNRISSFFTRIRKFFSRSRK